MSEVYITTYTGKKFELLNPAPEMVDIVDIAHSLSRLCRFNGHCKNFASVAQHCVTLSYLVPPEMALEGLLHDATEAYAGDLVSPLKGVLPAYKIIEDRIWLAIAEKFDLKKELPLEVKIIDKEILIAEARELLAVDYSKHSGLLEELKTELEGISLERRQALVGHKDIEMPTFWDYNVAREEFEHRFKQLKRD